MFEGNGTEQGVERFDEWWVVVRIPVGLEGIKSIPWILDDPRDLQISRGVYYGSPTAG